MPGQHVQGGPSSVLCSSGIVSKPPAGASLHVHHGACRLAGTISIKVSMCLFGIRLARRGHQVARGRANLAHVVLSVGGQELSLTMPTGRGACEPNQHDVVSLGDLRISSVGLGTISWSASNEESERALCDLAASAADACMLVDTAERYGTELGPPFDRWPFGRAGRCEEILGIALRGSKKPAVATKFTPTPWRNSRSDVVAACKASCQRLGVNQIDLYQIHHPDIVQPLKSFGLAWPRDSELWEGLADCVELGLARNIGVCNYGPTLLNLACDALKLRKVPLASNQINFSLLYRRQGVMPTIEACKARGVTVLAYWPLAMGLLSGSSNLSAPGRRGEELKRYLTGGGAIPPGGVQPLLDVLHDVASRRGRTCSQVALNWIMCRGAVPIPGACRLERLGEYVGALGWRLTDAEADELEAAAESLPFDFEGAGFRFSSAKFVGYGVERWYLD